jgi:hypothetical protein
MSQSQESEDASEDGAEPLVRVASGNGPNGKSENSS